MRRGQAAAVFGLSEVLAGSALADMFLDEYFRMNLSLSLAKKLKKMQEGLSMPANAMRYPLIDELVNEGILMRSGRIQKRVQLANPDALAIFLQNKFAIASLDDYIEVLSREVVTRSALATVAADSKLVSVRTFKGFLINAYEPFFACLAGKEIRLDFVDGVFQFIYDFETFVPDENLTIVGIENAENFRHISKQRHLFGSMPVLFVSRYPQGQSKDLLSWLSAIPNDYLHFGDFDFAGIGIYQNEFQKYLGDRARFFVPTNIGPLLERHGNAVRYDTQRINFDVRSIKEEKLLELIRLLHRHKKGLDQEVLIGR